MTNSPVQPKIQITSPEKVARLLEFIGQSGIPLIIRSVNAPTVAVKARAAAQLPGINIIGVKVGNISERGLQHLSQCGTGAFQFEFILKSEKIQFYSKLLTVGRQGCVFSIPAFLESIERRKNARYGIGENLLAFMSFKNMKIETQDFSAPPVFESARELAPLVPIADISVGGVGLQYRFPSICRVMAADRPIEPALLWLPMMGPTAVDVSVRWHRKLGDEIEGPEGSIRTVRRFKFGIQFLSLSEGQLHSIQVFLQRLSQADAI